MPHVEDVEPGYLHTVADFALQAGALLLASGAAAAEVVGAMLAIAQKAGVVDVSVDVTYAVLTFSYRSLDDDAAPYTRMQTIHGRTYNYGKLTEVSRLVERFCQGHVTLNEANTEIHRVAIASGPYPWWLTRIAAGAAGASAALIFGGDWLVMLAAFVANVVLDYLFGVLGRHKWPTFFMQTVAGVIAVLVAVLVHLTDPTVNSSLVVVAVIIVMLAGMTTTGGVQDAITGWYVTALGRIFEAVMNTIGLIVGIAFGNLVAAHLGIHLAISASVSMGPLWLPVILLASAFAAIGFSFVAQNPPRIIVPTALLAAIGYAVYTAASAANLGAVWPNAVAAFVIGLIAVVYTQWLKAPAAAFAVCAILPLLPGVALYQGLLGLNGFSALVTALGIALALAGGLTFGEYIASVAWRQMRIVENHFFAPLFATPFATQRDKSRTRGADNEENEEKACSD